MFHEISGKFSEHVSRNVRNLDNSAEVPEKFSRSRFRFCREKKVIHGCCAFLGKIVKMLANYEECSKMSVKKRNIYEILQTSEKYI